MARRKKKQTDDQTVGLDFGFGTHTDDATTAAYAKPPERKPKPSKPNDLLAARIRAGSEHAALASADTFAFAVARALELGGDAVARELCKEALRRYPEHLAHYLRLRELRAERVGDDVIIHRLAVG